MFAVFPRFDFETLAKLDLGIGPGKAITIMSELALKGAREKLKALHTFPPRFNPAG